MKIHAQPSFPKIPFTFYDRIPSSFPQLVAEVRFNIQHGVSRGHVEWCLLVTLQTPHERGGDGNKFRRGIVGDNESYEVDNY